MKHIKDIGSRGGVSFVSGLGIKSCGTSVKYDGGDDDIDEYNSEYDNNFGFLMSHDDEKY